MNKELEQRLYHISSELNSVSQVVDALLRIPVYSSPYQHSSVAAAQKMEALTCRMRSLVYESSCSAPHSYRLEAADIQGIKVTYENRILCVELPCLLPKRKLQNKEFLLGPLYETLSSSLYSSGFQRFHSCVVCFVHVYDRHLPKRMVRDYDNLEWKAILDAVGTFVLTDDTAALCDAYHTIEYGELDCTRILVMEKDTFPDWLKGRNGV